MTITRNGQNIELTRQELFEAHEAYEYIQADELMRERIAAEIDAEAVIDGVVETAIDKYLSDRDAGCEDEFCIRDALDAARETWKKAKIE